MYGGYAEIDGKGYIFPEAKCHQAHGDYWTDDDVPDIPIVDKETVGEYTGLKDRNGREVYEGDILHDHFCNNRYVVHFDSGSFDVRSTLDKSGNYLSDVVGDVEVIGNIHDNPELMK